MALSDKEVEAVEKIMKFLATLFIPPVLGEEYKERVVNEAVRRFVNHPLAGIILQHVYTILKRCYE